MRQEPSRRTSQWFTREAPERPYPVTSSLPGHWKCRATLAGTAGEYHFDCPLDNFFFAFAEISAESLKNFVATGASDEQVAKWIEQKVKKRPRVEIIKWNNEWRYKRLPDLPDAMQEFIEDYILQFVPCHLRHHINYLFDIYDAEENRIMPFWQRLT
jgi:hypothetical protein